MPKSELQWSLLRMSELISSYAQKYSEKKKYIYEIVILPIITLSPSDEEIRFKKMLKGQFSIELEFFHRV